MSSSTTPVELTVAKGKIMNPSPGVVERRYTNLQTPCPRMHNAADLAFSAEKITKNKQDKKKQLVDERKKKRSAKAEAKKTRKGNVKAAGKWTEERKAEIKAKKLARPANQEKRKQRLKDRAQKLELKAEQLLIEAKKAAAQYQALVDAEVCPSPGTWLLSIGC